MRHGDGKHQAISVTHRPSFCSMGPWAGSCHLILIHHIPLCSWQGSLIWDCGCLSFLLCCQSGKKSATAPSRERTKHPFPHVYVLSHFSCVQLCNPMDYSLSGSSVHGSLQVRILEWVAMPSSRGSSRPRSPTSQLNSLPSESPRKLKNTEVG